MTFDGIDMIIATGCGFFLGYLFYELKNDIREIKEMMKKK